MRLPYFLRSGKNPKALYFARCLARGLVPPALCRRRRDALLSSIAERPDRDEIEARAAYCCRLAPSAPAPLPDFSQTLFIINREERVHKQDIFVLTQCLNVITQYFRITGYDWTIVMVTSTRVFLLLIRSTWIKNKLDILL